MVEKDERQMSNTPCAKDIYERWSGFLPFDEIIVHVTLYVSHPTRVRVITLHDLFLIWLLYSIGIPE